MSQQRFPRGSVRGRRSEKNLDYGSSRNSRNFTLIDIRCIRVVLPRHKDIVRCLCKKRTTEGWRESPERRAKSTSKPPAPNCRPSRRRTETVDRCTGRSHHTAQARQQRLGATYPESRPNGTRRTTPVGSPAILGHQELVGRARAARHRRQDRASCSSPRAP